MLVPCHDTMPIFMIFRHVLDLHEFKIKVSRCSRPSHDAQMFEFHSHFFHGTQKFNQGHTCDFSTHFGAPEHVHAIHIQIMHIKSPETQIMYKRPNEPEIIPKFSRALIQFYVASVNKIRGGGSVYRFAHKGDTFPLGTTRLVERISGFARGLYQNLSQFSQKLYV